MFVIVRHRVADTPPSRSMTASRVTDPFYYNWRRGYGSRRGGRDDGFRAANGFLPLPTSGMMGPAVIG